ncbi:MAG: BTAD domain-containing putative transcriptional regulator [Actinomycetota bacterium]
MQGSLIAVRGMAHATINGERTGPLVEISLFGGVSAATADGAPIDVGPAKCQTVLAALALSPGSAVPVWRLVDMVWGEEPPRTAEKTLQSYVTRLRKGLGPESIVRTGVAYRLNVGADSVDVARFRRHLDSGNIEGALQEWTGTPLAGLDTGNLTATVDGLIEQWLGAVETDLDRRVESDPQATIGPLTELTSDYPFREGLWALLMTALYRVGRQADALAAYRTAREHLVEELGVEPGPRLRDLELLILDHDEQLGVDGSSQWPGSETPAGTVTFGFSDVEGSAKLWTAHRQHAAAALSRHDELVRAAVDDHGGYIFAAGGDSFGVAFHRAGDAVAWATQLQAATSSEPWPGGVKVRLRIGLHTGETEERENRYFGPAVNVGARIASAGHGGQTLLSGVTSMLIDEGNLVELGMFHLDGVVGQQRILQLGDDAYPPLRTADSRRGNLPRRLGRLIGRQDDLETIGHALAGSPIVTLVGPGGIGKTRLALAAARIAESDHREGAWLTEFAGIATSSDVSRAVANTLGVMEVPEQTLTESIVASLETRQVLLVLDNCEHVIDGAAEFAHAVAQRCPNVRVLATSREGLGLRDEQLIAVAPLDPAGPGVELFNERATAAARSFDPDSARSEVEEICRRLDGVPLAIELAAARTTSLSPADLVERLDNRLRLLTGGRRAGVERHRTLRATIQWSYDLLTPAEQTLFQRLSVFAGPFDLAAAEAIASGSLDADDYREIDDPDAGLGITDVDDLLGDLVDQSMVIADSGSFGRRFRLLETMRQFSAEHLYEAGQTELVATRHARWCLDEVAEIGRLLVGWEESEGVARLNELWANLRAAVEWALATGDLHLARALVSPVATEIGLRSRTEIGDWVERILAMAKPGDDDLIVFGLSWAAFRYMLRRDSAAYERLVERYGAPAHPLTRHARAFAFDEDEELLACSPAAVAELRLRGEDHVAELLEISSVFGPLLALGRFEEHDRGIAILVERYRRQGPPTFLNWTQYMLGFSALLQGDHERAERLMDESADIDVPQGTASLNEPIRARAALRRGDQMRAFQILRSHVGDLLDSDNVVIRGLAYAVFADMMTTIGHVPEAARIVSFLETSGGFAELAAKTFIADASNGFGADSEDITEQDRQFGRALDESHALEYMSDVLDDLLADGR